MIVQDVEIIPKTLREIFEDPHKKQHILKIIIQTLYNLGLDRSAQELERQSKITYMTPSIKSIKQALSQADYHQVETIIADNKIEMGELCELIGELKCMKMIREGKSEEALAIIQEGIRNPDRQAKLAQELMLGTGEIPKSELDRKHQLIVDKCLQRDISPHSMAKMINSYILLEKQGLTAAITPEFSLLKKPISTKSPPMRLVNSATSSRLKNIVFLRFNPRGTMIVAISSFKKQKSINLWRVNGANESLTEMPHLAVQTDEEVMGLSWNDRLDQETLCVAFETKIMVLGCPVLTVLASKRLLMGRHIKILTVEWNPLTNFLHVGGSFECIKVFSSSLEEVMTIQPFFRTRKICFNEEGTLMLAVSATRGLLTSFSLFDQKEESRLCLDEIITSFRVENKGRNAIVVSEKSLLYLHLNYQQPEELFVITHTFDNPYGNSGLIEVEAALFYPWVVCLGEEQFEAACLESENQRIERWDNKKSFTFDVSDKLMVSGSKEILLWMSGSFQDMTPEESEDREEDVLIEVQAAMQDFVQALAPIEVEAMADEDQSESEEEEEEELSENMDIEVEEDSQSS